MYCCGRCFGDRGLSKNIIPLLSETTGTCSYCFAMDVKLVSPSKLMEYFKLLINAYEPAEGGQPLLSWFRLDWGLFERLDDTSATNLLGNILDDAGILDATFSPASASSTNWVKEWQLLRDELMYRNRFFPRTDINLDRMSQLLSALTHDQEQMPDRWYRARIQIGGTPFKVEEMGAPPSRIASHGRANPAGIPYLYLASSAHTSVSEIRPHTGEVVCVCDFTVGQDLRFVDLRRPRKMVSPFLLEDAADITKMRNEDLPFLERLGEELTRPVVPYTAAIDYTPSQYLCEFIKREGYQGVIYRSSVSDGLNLALFDPALAAIGATLSQYRVSRVAVQVEEATAQIEGEI